jgi:hypothetical protein
VREAAHHDDTKANSNINKWSGRRPTRNFASTRLYKKEVFTTPGGAAVAVTTQSRSRTRQLWPLGSRNNYLRGFWTYWFVGGMFLDADGFLPPQAWWIWTAISALRLSREPSEFLLPQSTKQRAPRKVP